VSTIIGQLINILRLKSTYLVSKEIKQRYKMDMNKHADSKKEIIKYMDEILENWKTNIKFTIVTDLKKTAQKIEMKIKK
jgi:hypothetical protein